MLVACVLAIAPIVLAQTAPITINPPADQTIIVQCPNGTTIGVIGQVDLTSAQLICSSTTSTPILGETPVPVRTAVATDTPTLAPTATDTPSPPTSTPAVTDTPIPTIVPVATATPTPGSILINGVPLCQIHDVTKWHDLVARDAAGAIVCTYGHDHGSDPSVLDSVFGPLDANSFPGQEIGYPWLTSAAENSDGPLGVTTSDGRPIYGGKHRFFKWEVLPQSYFAQFGKPSCQKYSGLPYSFDDMRMEVHADGNSGATIRFHSFFVQLEACDPANPAWHGLIELGGHFDYGVLNAREKDPTDPTKTIDVRVPLPGDPTVLKGQRRTHGSIGPNGAFRGDFTWYGANDCVDCAPKNVTRIGISDGIREEDFGPIDPSNPTGPVLFYTHEGDPKQNHGWSTILDIIAANITSPASYKTAARPDGTFDWQGFVDRNGFVLQGAQLPCQLGTDCIPARLTNIKQGQYQFSNDALHLPAVHFDVLAPNGRSLILYPN